MDRNKQPLKAIFKRHNLHIIIEKSEKYYKCKKKCYTNTNIKKGYIAEQISKEKNHYYLKEEIL